MKTSRTVLAALLACGSTIAPAAPLAFYPVQTGAETVRYLRGSPTLTTASTNAVVEMTPLGADHGGYAFAVAVYNAGATPFNFGIEDIAVEVDGVAVAVLSKDRLVAKAQNRARWARVGNALLTGLSAAGDANTYSTTTFSGYVATPYGGAVVGGSVRDNSIGLMRASADWERGAAVSAAIDDRLDATVAEMSNNIIQTTTIDPRAAYAGRIVLDKSHGKDLRQIRITVTAAGAPHLFGFAVDTSGKAAVPAFGAITITPVALATVPAPASTTAMLAPVPAPAPATIAAPARAPLAISPAAYTSPAMSSASQRKPAARTANYRDVPVQPSAL